MWVSLQLPKKTKAKFSGAGENFAPTYKHILLGERKKEKRHLLWVGLFGW
jgi:hypothetical protein